MLAGLSCYGSVSGSTNTYAPPPPPGTANTHELKLKSSHALNLLVRLVHRGSQRGWGNDSNGNNEMLEPAIVFATVVRTLT